MTAKNKAVVLKLQDVCQSYDGKTRQLQNISLSLEQGQIGAIMGASGCGKTTLMRCIAGFEMIDQGRIVVAGREVASSAMQVPPEFRQVGVVFQDFALFPHLNLFENIAFGLDHLSLPERRGRVIQLLEAIDLAHKPTALPYEISGGEQQRVAIARALAPEPQIILLDEPFSNLDDEVRSRMKQSFRVLLKTFGVTALFVTHDAGDAFDLADNIGVMQDGRLHQWGPKEELYFRPQDRVVAEFLGDCAFLPVWVNEEGALESHLGGVPYRRDLDKLRRTPGLHLLLRPNDIVLQNAAPNGMVTKAQFRGMYQLYTIKLDGGGEVHSLQPSGFHHLQVGDRVSASLRPKEIILMAQ